MDVVAAEAATKQHLLVEHQYYSKPFKEIMKHIPSCNGYILLVYLREAFYPVDRSTFVRHGLEKAQGRRDKREGARPQHMVATCTDRVKESQESQWKQQAPKITNEK